MLIVPEELKLTNRCGSNQKGFAGTLGCRSSCFLQQLLGGLSEAVFSARVKFLISISTSWIARVESSMMSKVASMNEEVMGAGESTLSSGRQELDNLAAASPCDPFRSNGIASIASSWTVETTC